jgi:hypothetical protein
MEELLKKFSILCDKNGIDVETALKNLKHEYKHTSLVTCKYVGRKECKALCEKRDIFCCRHISYLKAKTLAITITGKEIKDAAYIPQIGLVQKITTKNSDMYKLLYGDEKTFEDALLNNNIDWQDRKLLK